jgi:hypothetical protein
MIVHLELFDQSLDLLGLRARADEHGVGLRDDDDIVEPDDGSEHGPLRAH